MEPQRKKIRLVAGKQFILLIFRVCEKYFSIKTKFLELSPKQFQEMKKAGI